MVGGGGTSGGRGFSGVISPDMRTCVLASVWRSGPCAVGGVANPARLDGSYCTRYSLHGVARGRRASICRASGGRPDTGYGKTLGVTTLGHEANNSDP